MFPSFTTYGNSSLKYNNSTSNCNKGVFGELAKFESIIDYPQDTVYYLLVCLVFGCLCCGIAVPARVGNQPQSTGGHRFSNEASPVDHCGGIRRFCGGHRWTTGGGTHSPTGGHRLFYRWYKDDADPAKIGRSSTEL